MFGPSGWICNVTFLRHSGLYCGKFSSNDRKRCEIEYETPMITYSTFVREDVCVYAFNASSGKDRVDRDGAVSECWGDMNASALEALLAHHQIRL